MRVSYISCAELQIHKGWLRAPKQWKLNKGDIVEVKGITTAQVCYIYIICSTYFFW